MYFIYKNVFILFIGIFCLITCFFSVNNFHFSMTVNAFLQTVFTFSQLSPKCPLQKISPNQPPTQHLSLHLLVISFISLNPA